MRRIYPRRYSDPVHLSLLLDGYIAHLAAAPLEVSLKRLSYDTQIPESVFRRLMLLHHCPEDAPNIRAADFHILFANVMFRYPTVKIWEGDDGHIFFES